MRDLLAPLHSAHGCPSIATSWVTNSAEDMRSNFDARRTAFPILNFWAPVEYPADVLHEPDGDGLLGGSLVGGGRNLPDFFWPRGARRVGNGKQGTPIVGHPVHELAHVGVGGS